MVPTIISFHKMLSVLFVWTLFFNLVADFSSPVQCSGVLHCSAWKYVLDCGVQSFKVLLTTSVCM